MLGIGILGFVGGATATSPTRAANRSPDAETAKSIFAELLSIDTTYDKGTVVAVQALRTRFLAAGFPEADLVVAANPDNPSQSNLIVRLHCFQARPRS